MEVRISDWSLTEKGVWGLKVKIKKTNGKIKTMVNLVAKPAARTKPRKKE